jgi:hypothetical protein
MMRAEPATILVIILGSLFFFFLLLPLVATLQRLPKIWREDRRNGMIYLGIVITNSVFFLILWVGLFALIYNATLSGAGGH